MMRNYFYLNVNGFYGTREKNRDKLKAGLDDSCCLKNAESICNRIVEDGVPKYDAIFSLNLRLIRLRGNGLRIFLIKMDIDWFCQMRKNR